MMGSEYKEAVRKLYMTAVAEALDGAVEVKEEYADKILALGFPEYYARRLF